MHPLQYLDGSKATFVLRRNSQLVAGKTPHHERGLKGLLCFSSSSSSKEFSSSFSKNDRNINNNKKFPWRHSTNLLPRVELHMVRLQRYGWKYKAATSLWEGTTALLMKKPFSEVILGGEWRRELAENSAGAWTLGSAALLSNTFKVPMDDLIIREGGDIKLNFSYTTPYTPTVTTSTQSTENIQENVNKNITTASSTDVDGTWCDEYVALYRNFYRQSHEHQSLLQINPIEITLTMEPRTADLSLLYAFPFLSRSMIKEDPTRMDAFQEILTAATTTSSDSGGGGPVVFYKKLMAFGDKMLAERGKMETTVIADVVVTCLESFQVKDLISDEIIQGGDDGSTKKEVIHTIRMEMDLTFDVMNDDDPEVVMTNWRVADVDGMATDQKKDLFLLNTTMPL